MMNKLLTSALQTGWLSVESEALIRQVLVAKGCQPEDLKALEYLQKAVESGDVRREAPHSVNFLTVAHH